jgi:4'-phosphopantetheinyl transferase EntD
MVTRRRPSPPGRSAEASYGGPAPRLSGEQRAPHPLQDSRQRQLEAVRGCARTALARAGLPPLPTPHPFATSAAPPPRAPAPAAPQPPVPWDALVDSAKESVRLTWFPMVGRMIGLDDSMLRPLPAPDGTAARTAPARGARTPPTERTPRSARHDW